MCVKLPLAVEMTPDKVKILEEDVAATQQAKVAKRQEVVLKVIELLFNPLNVSMRASRSQVRDETRLASSGIKSQLNPFSST